MPVPLVLTAAAIGATWLLARGGSATPPAPSSDAPAPAHDTTHAPTAGDAAAVGAAGLIAGADCAGPVTVGDAGTGGVVGPRAELAPTEVGLAIDETAGTGTDPSVSPSAPVVGLAVAPADATPSVSPMSDTDAIMTATYGTTSGLSLKQESDAIRTYGSLAGMVW